MKLLGLLPHRHRPRCEHRMRKIERGGMHERAFCSIGCGRCRHCGAELRWNAEAGRWEIVL